MALDLATFLTNSDSVAHSSSTFGFLNQPPLRSIPLSSGLPPRSAASMAPRGRPLRVSTSKRTPCKSPFEDNLQLVRKLIPGEASKVATPQASVPSSRAPSRRSTRNAKAIEIPDSDGIEEIIISDPVVGVKTTFQGVYVPSIGRTSSRRGRTTTSASTAASSIADSLESSNYETPGTSTAQTPNATSQPASRSKVGATARAIQLSTSNFALGGSKKKRGRRDTSEIDTGYEQEDNDAMIAAKLQAEEYNAIPDSDESDSEPLSKRRRVTRQRPAAIELFGSSDEDDIPLVNRQRKTPGNTPSAYVQPSS